MKCFCKGQKWEGCKKCRHFKPHEADEVCYLKEANTCHGVCQPCVPKPKVHPDTVRLNHVQKRISGSWCREDLVNRFLTMIGKGDGSFRDMIDADIKNARKRGKRSSTR
jgi:hypothetical protein